MSSSCCDQSQVYLNFVFFLVRQIGKCSYIHFERERRVIRATVTRSCMWECANVNVCLHFSLPIYIWHAINSKDILFDFQPKIFDILANRKIHCEYNVYMWIYGLIRWWSSVFSVSLTEVFRSRATHLIYLIVCRVVCLRVFELHQLNSFTVFQACLSWIIVSVCLLFGCFFLE